MRVLQLQMKTHNSFSPEFCIHSKTDSLERSPCVCVCVCACECVFVYVVCVCVCVCVRVCV